MKKIIFFGLITSTLIISTNTYGMMFRQCRPLQTTKTFCTTAVDNKNKSNNEKIILRLQQEIFILNQQISALKQTNNPATLSIQNETQRVIDFRSIDQVNPHKDK